MWLKQIPTEPLPLQSHISCDQVQTSRYIYLRRTRCGQALHSVSLALLRFVVEDAVAQEKIARVQLPSGFITDEACAELGLIAIMAELYHQTAVSNLDNQAKEPYIQGRTYVP